MGSTGGDGTQHSALLCASLYPVVGLRKATGFFSSLTLGFLNGIKAWPRGYPLPLAWKYQAERWIWCDGPRSGRILNQLGGDLIAKWYLKPVLFFFLSKDGCVCLLSGSALEETLWNSTPSLNGAMVIEVLEVCFLVDIGFVLCFIIYKIRKRVM